MPDEAVDAPRPDEGVTGEVTSLLVHLDGDGRERAFERLMDLVYEELHLQGLFRLNRLVPALSRGMPRYVGMLGRAPPDSLTRRTRIDSSVSVDLRPLLRDPDFRAVVDELWISHENLRVYIQGMLNETSIGFSYPVKKARPTGR